MAKYYLKAWVSFLSILYLCFISVLGLAEFWPESLWWVANMFEVLPLWVLLFPAGILGFLSISNQLKREVILNTCSLAIILFFILGFNVPLNLQASRSSKDTIQLRVMTANIGAIKDLGRFFEFIEKIKPDIIAIEESTSESQQMIKDYLAFKKWDVEFDAQLGIASQFKIIDSKYRNRRMFGGWGTVVGKYSLETSKGIIHFLIVHLETPRKGIEALMDDKLAGIDEMKRITQNQEAESVVSFNLIKDFSPAIIVGDFNMLKINPIFRKYWSSYGDAFSQKGIGFGYTKNTRWHGVRIDHILTDSNWVVHEVYVGEDIGGDHRPVVADIEFIGRFDLIKDFQSLKVEKKSEVNPEDIYVLEDFENSLGRFTSANQNQLVLVKNFAGRSSRVLKASSSTTAEQFSVGFNIESWPLEKFSSLKFLYNTAFGTPIGLAVQTSLGDWICVGGVIGYQCPAVKSPAQINFSDDGQWHEVSINIRTAVQSLVPAVNNLKALQFFIPANRHQGDGLYLDDVMIVK